MNAENLYDAWDNGDRHEIRQQFARREEIIRMAREQGLPETAAEGVFIVNTDDLGRMLAAEREACAKVCDVLGNKLGMGREPDPNDCAASIRARGQA